MTNIIVHLVHLERLAEDEADAINDEEVRLTEVIRAADPATVAVGDEFIADGQCYRIVRVDQRLARDIN